MSVRSEQSKDTRVQDMACGELTPSDEHNISGKFGSYRLEKVSQARMLFEC